MEIILLTLAVLILVQTSYLTYRSAVKGSTSSGDILLDTSVLIDGRIVAIARSGLISSRLIIPRSVVRELQFMADKADHDKRERARYGLEVIEKMQQLPGLEVSVTDDGVTSEHGVDEQLILLAQRTGARLCTIDYNLNKAARVQSVHIININELAHALRVIHLPGENISVELVQPGQDKKQAVGYLDDGTMVVVDDARELIGQSVAVEVTRILQTAAGRMMFAKRVSSGSTGSSGAVRRQDKATRTRTPNKHSEDERPSTSTPIRRPSRGGKSIRSSRKRSTPEETLVDLANQ